MLGPLDPQRLDAFVREGDDDEGVEFLLHCHLEALRKDVKEGEDWGTGVMAILHEGGRFLAFVQRTRPMTYEEMRGSNEWYIDFYVCGVDRPYASAITDSLSRNSLSKI